MLSVLLKRKHAEQNARTAELYRLAAAEPERLPSLRGAAQWRRRLSSKVATPQFGVRRDHLPSLRPPVFLFFFSTLASFASRRSSIRLSQKNLGRSEFCARIENEQFVQTNQVRYSLAAGCVNQTDTPAAPHSGQVRRSRTPGSSASSSASRDVKPYAPSSSRRRLTFISRSRRSGITS